ncbi:hypothetical protein, partial [Pseudoalteromonas sp. Of7M-16]|uniref:hypothetical protein n=1 Tax=Pseudoalteromonas sp. Of7M-16 TaxID=2917756 RepID=UPI001EF737C3
NAPQLTAPEVQPFQVTQSQPSPVNLTPPETVLNMPGPVRINDPFDSPLPETSKTDPFRESASTPEPLALPNPDLSPPDILKFQFNQPEHPVPDIFHPPSKPPELPAVWHKAEQQENKKPDKQQDVRGVSVEYKVNPIINISGSQPPNGLTENDVRRTVIKVFQHRESELIHALDDALRELYSRHEYLN